MNTKPTTSLYLDTRREKEDETYPIKLRITFKGIRKYYSVYNYSVTENEFEIIYGDRIPRETKLKDILKQTNIFKHKADEFIIKSKAFTFQLFKNSFINATNPLLDDVYSYYNAYIKTLVSEGRLNTAESYEYSLKSLKDFHNGNTLPFDNIDEKFLAKYERVMLKDYSITTIGFWLRPLRAIINTAIRDGITSSYPFGKGKYQIKNPPARKMALTSDELRKLFEYKSDIINSENFFFDLWKFSYLCNGMNVKDICCLKYSNIERKKIFYLREKTRRTNLKGKEIVIPISKEIKAIIDKWGTQPKIKDSYIFPLLKPKLTDKEAQMQIKQAIKQINKYVKRVAKELEIEINISSYTARHSYATQLMRHGAPAEFISKQLGHSSIETTNVYLENFEERQINEWQKKITDFNL